MLNIKKNDIFVTVLTFLAAMIIISFCSPRIENKAHVKQQVQKMYKGYTTHPMKDLANRFNEAVSGGGSIYGMDVSETLNRRCRMYIAKDSLLADYFRGFIKRCDDPGLSIYDLNFHGLPVREQLQKELGVALLE